MVRDIPVLLSFEAFVSSPTHHRNIVSEKDDGAIQTIQSFSTDAGGRLAGETYFEIWVDYWGAADYADVFTSSACQGTGTFTGESFFTRSECCLMGAQ